MKITTPGTAPSPHPHRFFAADGAALRAVRHILRPARMVRIATAYFEPTGYQLLHRVLEGKTVRLLVGRTEGGCDRAQEVLREFVDRLADFPFEDRLQAMRAMLAALDAGLLTVAVGSSLADPSRRTLLDARYLYHHAKLYMADEGAVLVTSANLSHHGLVRSREAGCRVTDPEDVAYFVRTFDAYFEQAESISQELAARLRACVNAAPPFDVYARALLELYGMHGEEETVRPGLPRLAEYQRPVVARILQALQEFGGAMLIASTGLGKTIMVAHVVAQLRMRGEVDHVIVVCPAGLRETWRRHMIATRVASAAFSYHTLSVTDPERDRSLRSLLHDLNQVTTKTLVILDESHHLRNPKATGGDEKERYQRVREAVRQRGAKVLMLTATPFSRDVEDINAHLNLLPEARAANPGGFAPLSWKVVEIRRVSELPPCAALTLPNVVASYSQRDEDGSHYVVFGDGSRRYFPTRLHLHTEVLRDPLNGLLAELLSGRLLVAHSGDGSPRNQINLFDQATPDAGHDIGAFKANIMRKFCSSPPQVAELFGKLRKPGGFEKIRFARQGELGRFAGAHVEQVTAAWSPNQDAKLKRLLEIIRGRQSAKVLVFCEFLATARALKQAVLDHLPGIFVDTTSDKDLETLERLIRRFAPAANEVPGDEQAEPIDVLIATGTMAEGYNLQDATILVNYDLPWTVMVLAQRMGRILRPWHEPRDIHVYNFVPDTMADERIAMAMNWQKRLLTRNREHRSFADIPVIVDGTTGAVGQALEMASLAQALIDLEHDQPLDLFQAMEFLENSERVETSTFLQDLSKIQEVDRRRVEQYAAGVRTARLTDDRPLLFLLLRDRGRHYPALFDQDGRLVQDHTAQDAIMGAIRCERDEPVAPPSRYPIDAAFDAWVDRAVGSWLDVHGSGTLRQVPVVCAMALLPVRP